MENILFDEFLIYSGKGYFNKTNYTLSLLNSVDSVSDYFNSDFYGFGMTRQDNMKKQGIPLSSNYFISGTSLIDNKSAWSIVSLLTMDFEHIKTILSDSQGNYKFENIPLKSYIIIAADPSLRYNHSIQVGVKPVAQD